MRIILITLMALLYSCAPKTFSIGVISSNSGKFSGLGHTCIDGANLAMEQYNKTANIKLKLNIVDDESNPEKAMHAVLALADDNMAIVGPFTTSSAERALDSINEKKIPTIGPVIAGSTLSKGDDYFFKYYPNTQNFGIKIGEHIKSRNQGTITVIFDVANQSYGTELIEGLRTILPNIQIISFDSRQASSLEDVLKKYNWKKVDYLVISARDFDVAYMAQWLKTQSHHPFMYSSSWGISDILVAQGGSAVEGMMFYLPFDRQILVDSLFKRRFFDRFDYLPTFCSLFYYQAIDILSQLLPTVEGKEQLQIALTNLKKRTFEREEMIFDQIGDMERNLSLYQINQGHIVRARGEK